MYDPTIGRWTTQDPLGFDAGDANLYRYVGNDATDAVDPTGLERPGFLPSGEHGWSNNPPIVNPGEKPGQQGVPMGIPALIGGGLVAGGAPIIPKGGAGFPYTSVFSTAAGAAPRIPLPRPLPTWSPWMGLRWTANLGRFTARWIPFVGWVLIAYDLYRFSEWMDENPVPPDIWGYPRKPHNYYK